MTCFIPCHPCTTIYLFYRNKISLPTTEVCFHYEGISGRLDDDFSLYLESSVRRVTRRRNEKVNLKFEPLLVKVLVLACSDVASRFQQFVRLQRSETRNVRMKSGVGGSVVSSESEEL